MFRLTLIPFPFMNRPTRPLSAACSACACRAVDEGKLYLLLSEKNTVALFGTSFSYRSMSFSFRSSGIARFGSDWTVGFSGMRRFCWIQRFKVEKPIPKSAASRLRGSPLVKATRTASAWNSSVGRDAICVLLCHTLRGQRGGTNP